jgi:Carboxypeptidase regulatory-like domain/TonB dependent receptor-like, beta-barrel
MLRRCSCVAVVVFLFTHPVFGQGAVAEVNGSVADQSGALLPGATITITEEATGLVRTVVSNEIGRFVLPAVTPGRYAIKAELAGFQTQTRTGIAVLVGQAITINLTLPVGTLTDQVTVTGEAPLVEVTQTQIGANITSQNIQDLPTQGRQQYALLALVPGLTPTLGPGAFEGSQYSANGRDTGSNLFLVDGAYNVDDRTLSGSGAQTRMTIDTTGEYQVLVHEYGAEYGGSSGVVVNAVTKSGTNAFHGAAAFYIQDSSLDATNYFLKLAGRENPDSGVKTWLGQIGGPIVRNKMFFFGNAERLRIREAANLLYPPEAAPLAVSYSTFLPISSENYFARVDYQLTQKNNVSFRMLFDPNRVDGQSHVVDKRTLSAMRIERVPTPGETFLNGQWVSLMGNRMVNELRLSNVREDLMVGDRALFEGVSGYRIFDVTSHEFVGLKGDQLDFGSGQMHPDYLTGPHASPSGASVHTINFSDQLTYTPGSHTLKLGFATSKNGGTNIIGANYFGLYAFNGNRPFDPADASTYPIRFQIRLGELFFQMPDWRYNLFVADKWQVAPKLTLNLGVRYDYQHEIPQTKDAFAPRLGVAYAPSEKTLIRGGVGKFYEYQATALFSNIAAGAVNSPAFIYDTGQDNNPLSGRLPTRDLCLLPTGNAGLAVISAACRAQLVARRDAVAAAGEPNTEPVLDGDRKMAYLLGFNVGVQREIMPGMAIAIDYVGNRGRNQTARIDINEPRVLSDGQIGRPGPAVFDPDGTLIPASARNAAFRRVLQYQTRPEFNTDYDALEVSLNRRMANRWSGRLGYTLSRAHDVNAGTTGGGNIIEKRVNDDLNPRLDYGLTNFNNTHAITAGANWEAWRGLSVGATGRYYSGNPVNEIVGLDVTGDVDATDRPVKGRDDVTLPIVSKLDANGMAIRNGIEARDKLLLDLRLQYVHGLGGQRTAGFYWEIYNATNRVNFGPLVGDRRSPLFMQSTVADAARTMQLGVRYTF